MGAACLDVTGCQITETYEAIIRHDEYNYTKKALEVNGIDLRKHDNDPKSESVTEALQSFEDWLSGLKPPDRKLIAGGHNLPFDKAFLCCGLSPTENTFFDWDVWFHYRTVDTQVLLTAMRHAGIMNVDSTGLDALIDFFDLEVEHRHGALDDAIATAESYLYMVEVLRDMRKSAWKYDNLNN